jgi:competence protein ComEA
MRAAPDHSIRRGFLFEVMVKWRQRSEEARMSKRRIAQVVFLSLVGIVAFVVIYVILKRPEPASPPLVITLQPRPTAEPVTPTPATINVYVSGAVNKPDVYALPLNSIVKDAIEAAGGATEDADLDRINLATAWLIRCRCTCRAKANAAPMGATASTERSASTASAKNDKLPGIGSDRHAIIDYRTERPFKMIRTSTP